MFTKRQLKIGIIKQLTRALIFVTIASIAIYILGGQISKIGQMAKENRTAAAILEQKNQMASEIKADLVSIGDGDKKIEEAFIKTENIIEFINSLEKIALNNGLEQTLKFGNPVPIVEQAAESEENKTADALELMKVEYDIKLRGGVEDFNNYLQDFEKLPYFTGISSIAITASPTTGWEKQTTISIMAQLYITQ